MAGVPREAIEMNEHHYVEDVRVGKDSLSLTVDGAHVQCELKYISTLLAGATEEEKNTFEVSPSGYGIRWPLIDEDLSIDGLLGIVHSPESDRKSA
jgi:hypothetical protein